MTESVTVKGEGLTLDLILWRRYGVRGRSLVEAALAANPGLAMLGPELPLGTVIIIPDLPPQTTAVQSRVSLFG